MRRRACRSTRSKRSCAASCALGVRKLRLTGGEPLLRKRLPELVRAARRDRRARRPRPDHQRLAAGRAGACAARGRAAAASRSASMRWIPQLFRAMSGGRGEVADVLAGIDAARGGRLRIDQAQLRGRSAASTRTRCCRWSSASRGTATCCASSSTWTSAPAMAGARERRGAFGANCATASHARWPLRPLEPHYRGEVASRYAFADGGGEVGFVSSVSEPFCGDCHRARVSADGRLYTCLFAARRPRPARRRWRRARPRWRERVAERLVAPRATVTASCAARASAPRKHVEMYLDWRLRWRSSKRASSSTHLDPAGRPAMVDVSAKAVTAREASRRMPRALPGRRRRAAARQRPEERQGRRSSTPRSSPARWRSSARTS